MSESDAKAVNKTFRIRSQLVRRIEADAKKAGISTNMLVNNILTRYAEWDRVTNEIGFVSLPPNMLHAFLHYATADVMEKVGELIFQQSCFKDLSLHCFQRYDPDTFMKLSFLLQKYANNYKIQESWNGDGWTHLSFYHDFGTKWSRYIGALLHNELLRLGIKDHQFEMSDNAVVFSFPLKVSTPHSNTEVRKQPGRPADPDPGRHGSSG